MVNANTEYEYFLWDESILWHLGVRHGPSGFASPVGWPIWLTPALLAILSAVAKGCFHLSVFLL
jgi:hypothetical protein